MELDDLKNDWESINSKSNKQNILTSKHIDEMTYKKYYLRINKIKYSELAGGIICLLGAIFIGFNYNKLNTIFLQLIGVAAILLLMILPAISLISLLQFSMAGDVNKSYADTIKQFAFKKIRFQKYQHINVLFSYILLVTIIILLPKFFFEKDVTGNKYLWTFAFSFGYIFLLFFARWVKKFYNNSLRQAEELLRETEI